MTRWHSSIDNKATAEYLESALSAGVLVMVREIEFEELVKRFEPLIKKQIRQIHGTIYYDELYQIGLIAIWEAKNRFNEEKGYFPSFVKKYIRGRMLKFLYKEKRLRDRTTSSEPLQFVPTSDKEWTTIQLRPLLPHLSDREKFWLIEFLEHGKGIKQIAAEQSVSVDTVATWRKRAIKKLKKLM